jgi:two-component system sensor histidine kinase/response regulator
MRILYLEDDPGLARLTQRVLAREGITVETVGEGREALRRTASNDYDAILVDFRLPGMDGLEVIRELVLQPESPPVLMITGEGDESLAVEALKAGAADYMVKDSQSQFLNLAPMRIKQAIEQAQILRDKQAAEEAKAKLVEELDAFAHTVAHDLKSPIQNVLMNLDMLDLVSEEERKKLCNRLRGELERSKRIVDSLLLFATVGKDEIELMEVSLGTGVQSALLRLQPQIEEAGAKITLPETWPSVMGRSDWLEEVWSNYLSNALRYGGEKPEITIGWKEQGDMIRAWLQDDGPGVREEIQQNLFTPLTKRHQSFGTGLGLSIIGRIMERFDGIAGYDSSFKEGARFFIEIPKA